MKFYCLVCEKEKTGEPIKRNVEASAKGLPAGFCRSHAIEDCWAANRQFQKQLRESRRDYRKRNQVKLHRPTTAPLWWAASNSPSRQRAVELFRRIPKAAWAECAFDYAKMGGAYDTKDADVWMDNVVVRLRSLSADKLI